MRGHKDARRRIQCLSSFNFQLLTVVILFFQLIKYQIMNQKSSSADDEGEGSGRFLMRHSSSSVLNLFGCCSPSASQEFQLGQLERTPPPKISIKNVLKKSAIYGCNANSSINQSRLYQGGKRSEIGSSSQKFLNRKISQFSQISGQTLNNRSERTTPRNIGQNINLIYNKDSQDKSIHNYHTTNVMVEKYIVQAEETNVFLKDLKEKKMKSNDFPHFNPRGQVQMEKTEHYRNSSPKWGQEINHIFTSKFPVNNSQNSQLNCHFSFGQHQKNMFVNKFGGFREVCSNRPSKQSVNVDNEEEAVSIDFTDKQPKPFNFMKNKNEKLHNLVRNVTVLNEDINDINSDKSEVIDSYQNFMSRIQDRSKITEFRGQQQP